MTISETLANTRSPGLKATLLALMLVCLCSSESIWHWVLWKLNLYEQINWGLKSFDIHHSLRWSMTRPWQPSGSSLQCFMLLLMPMSVCLLISALLASPPTLQATFYNTTQRQTCGNLQFNLPNQQRSTPGPDIAGLIFLSLKVWTDQCGTTTILAQNHILSLKGWHQQEL